MPLCLDRLCKDGPSEPQDLCVAVLHSPRFKSAAARDKDGMTASLGMGDVEWSPMSRLLLETRGSSALKVAKNLARQMWIHMDFSVIYAS